MLAAPEPRKPSCTGRRGMLKRLLIGLAVAAIVGVPLPADAAVTLSMRDGRVWLQADRATIAEILAEWARVGRTHIVNAEHVRGAPLTVDLRGVPELEALDIILRSAGGFVTMSRTAGLDDAAANVSGFSRLVIVPSANPAKERELRPAPPAPSARPVPVPAPALVETGGQRVIGPDGQPVPDDQEDAPPPPPRPLPALPPGMSMPPGFSEPPDARPKRTAFPGVISLPAKPPRPGGDPTSR